MGAFFNTHSQSLFEQSLCAFWRKRRTFFIVALFRTNPKMRHKFSSPVALYKRARVMTLGSIKMRRCTK